MAEEDKRKGEGGQTDFRELVKSIREQGGVAKELADYRRLADKYKELFSNPQMFLLLGPMIGVEDCWPLATCIRVTASDNQGYKDAEFLPIVKKYFEAVRDSQGQDTEARVAYFLLGMVADRESGWKTEFSEQELFGRLVAEKTQGVEIPQGEPGDPYGLGEVPAELVAYAKGVLLDHLKTTQSWQDIKDMNDLMVRATRWIGDGVDSDDTYLKVADCNEFILAVEDRRDEFEKMGEAANRELERFDSLKEKLAKQPRHEDGAE